MLRLKNKELKLTPAKYFGYDKDDTDKTNYKFLDVVVDSNDIVFIQSVFTYSVDPGKLYLHYTQSGSVLAYWVRFHNSLKEKSDVLTCVNLGDCKFGGNPIPVYRADVRSTKEFGKVLEVIQYLPFSEIPFEIYSSDVRDYFENRSNNDEFIFLEKDETMPKLPKGRYILQVIV